jgi:cellulose synthase/poly-beta-1,6-N-acetylglucosamine synthase-like glycosyltransferase
MMTPEILAPTLLAAGALLTLFTLKGRESALARVIAALICVACAGRYLWWRFAESMPHGLATWQEVWAWTFVIIEAATVLSTATAFLFMARHRNRSAEADRLASSPLLAAPVDVFIATYNEPFDVLERTIVAAKAIAHPDLRVWVLDDGARGWVRDLAGELGCEYVQRRNGKHAKAGNVNNGLRHALSSGRRPDHVLLLDADFAPARNILQRTLGFFQDPSVGIVQTPQHFFNPDRCRGTCSALRSGQTSSASSSAPILPARTPGALLSAAAPQR